MKPREAAAIGAVGLLGLGAAMLVAACSSSASKITALETGDDDDDASSTGTGAGTTTGDAATGTTNGDGGASGGDGSVDETDAAYNVSVVCTSLSFAAGTRVPLTMTNFASFGGITPSPTSLVWIDTSGTVYVADRAETFDPFSSTIVQAGSDASAGAIRSQINVLGSAVYVTSADNSGLMEYDRIEPMNPFDAPSTAGLAAINGQLSAAGLHVAEIAVGGFADTMFLLAQSTAPSTGDTSAFTLYESTLGEHQTTWPAATTHTESALRSTGTGARRIPTGVSFDGRVLFYYDEPTSTEMVAVRATGSGDFTTFQTLGAFKGAAPVQNCSGIFYVGSDSSGAGVFSDYVDPSAPGTGG